VNRLGASILSILVLAATGCTNLDNCTDHMRAVNGQVYPKPVGYFPGLPVNDIPANMPDRAARGFKEGLVDLAFLLKTDGTVANIRIIQETPEGYGFGDEAQRVFRNWRFQPRLVSGKPVDTEAVYRLLFKFQMTGPLFDYCPY